MLTALHDFGIPESHFVPIYYETAVLEIIVRECISMIADALQSVSCITRSVEKVLLGLIVGKGLGDFYGNYDKSTLHLGKLLSKDWSVNCSCGRLDIFKVGMDAYLWISRARF